MTQHGTLIGLDLTVPNAPQVRDFYAAVIGWGVQGLKSGEDYDDQDDYFMTGPDGVPVAAKGRTPTWPRPRRQRRGRPQGPGTRVVLRHQGPGGRHPGPHPEPRAVTGPPI
jgi:hypothetical protein